MSDLADCLHPEHGAVLVNLHRGEVPSVFRQLALKLQGRVWKDPFVTPVAEVYRCATHTPPPPPILAKGLCCFIPSKHVNLAAGVPRRWRNICQFIDDG